MRLSKAEVTKIKERIEEAIYYIEEGTDRACFCDVGDYDVETLMHDFKLAINELKEVKKIPSSANSHFRQDRGEEQ